ncbi:UDP-2,3-diacylglucosamine diphosphatase [Lysobacter sp. HDW10]|uniref:UDP-2,3-diacylglucosamine diphosphatase n=1 Tax=Lysobacter sp. HDW10 TaxID=2714936 RepID=UPI00140B927F|nr:UDP-2,3-diacylglucosamine diphosphatase [Lysobacter sp. HDW10]QIK81362.1 UDP-2,3-diacylglucosamine diphosphatase [Lysobacter sp. HDW10]
MTTFFVSDTHLEDVAPDNTTRFVRYLSDEVRGASALYILGDLFEAWIGDDDPSECGARAAEAIKGVSDSGTPVFFIHGNRDFLLGRDYAARCGMQLLPDPSVVMVEGQPLLIGHGDLLCTDDAAYQQFRAMTRNPEWRAQFLAQPLAARLAFAAQAREASKARYGELKAQGTHEVVGDVSKSAVREMFSRFGLKRMIHGHTHRPAVHTDEGGERIVLGDWYGVGTVARADAGAVQLYTLKT